MTWQERIYRHRESIARLILEEMPYIGSDMKNRIIWIRVNLNGRLVHFCLVVS